MYKKRLLIGMCSWNNYDILKVCIDSLLESIDLSLDGIAVVLNKSDIKSVNYLHNLKIPFVSVPENRGVLAIDYLLPFIQNSQYFLNSNDDMIYHQGFAEELINIIDNNYPCSATCMAVENYYSNNGGVIVDETLGDILDPNTKNNFLTNVKNKKYIMKNNIISYNHPICVKSVDYLNVGGYSGNWDMDFFSGYSRDDMFAIQLYNLHNKKFNFYTTKNSVIFHASSSSFKKIPKTVRDAHSNQESLLKKTGLTINQFRNIIQTYTSANINYENN